VDEQCENCGSLMTFTGYEYWEDDDNGEPIILPTLVTDNPDLTPENECWYCANCDTRWAVLIDADGTRKDAA
jgi:hypothetical protein